MEFITLTRETLPREHICCALSGTANSPADAKKAWLAERMDEGLVFRRADARGKCFIEYLPAEAAWAPVDAAGYAYIDCLWVSGQFKGHGYAARLLSDCVRDCKEKGMRGLAALSSVKKLPFLADRKFLLHAGFQVVDTIAESYLLMALPFSADAPTPRFRDGARAMRDGRQGFALYYSPQCPYAVQYAPKLAALARAHGAPCEEIRFERAAQAQDAPSPFTSFCLFFDGAFVTQEILSEAKFEKLLADKGF